MKRDGATISLWQATTPDEVPGSETQPVKAFDVLVAGGGITGITTALLLQKSGRQCLLAEARNLCFGTTGGTTAHINSFFDTSYHQVQSDFGTEAAQLLAEASRQARALFRQHVQEYRIDCGYEEKNGYVYAQNSEEADLLETIFRAARQAGVEVEYSPQIPVPVAFEKALLYKGQAQIHPTRYVQALAKAFVALGGVIRENCPVEAVQKEGDRLQVTTANGMVEAKSLVYATHIPPGINLLHFRNAPYRSYAIAVTLNDERYPDGLAYDMKNPYHYYRTQEIDGQKYLIVGGEDHKTAHQKNTEACFNQLIAHTRTYFDVAAVTHRWSSQFYDPSDGLAYIGHLPGHPEGVYVATGYSGNGITYSHVAALVLCDLVTKGQSPFGELFRPGRIKPVAGFAAFVKENADVVAQFVGKRINTRRMEALAELAPGEAGVVKYEGDRIALYKDESGKLYALNPVCTHAKCVVAWNDAEKSWDCPCHGARYSIQGEVVTGPATKGLEQISLEEKSGE